jgi:hypothetical protein
LHKLHDLANLTCVAGLPFDNQIFSELGDPDLGVGKKLANARLNQVQVVHYVDFKAVCLPVRGRNDQIGDADALTDQAELPWPEHIEVGDSRVAYRD